MNATAELVTPRGIEGDVLNATAFDIPELITKQLKMYVSPSGKKKVKISSNWLRLMDLAPGTPVVERSLGRHKGMVVERAYDLFDQMPTKTKHIYERGYSQRKNNPLESLYEVSSQRIINESFPPGCTRLYITFERGRLTILPLTTLQERALDNAERAEDKLSAFCALTSGIDAHAMQHEGFAISGLLDLRPVEARDLKTVRKGGKPVLDDNGYPVKRVTDLTETGLLTALANLTGVKNVFNEDIYQIDVQRIAERFVESPFMVFHACPQCDDVSSAKRSSLKDQAIKDTSSTVDMTLDVLNMVNAMAPPVCVFENVQGWPKHPVYELLSLRMRRNGYREHLLNADARDFGGLSSRARSYAVFSILDAPFSFEEKVPQNTDCVWSMLKPYFNECRDVTDNNAIRDGAKQGLLRVVRKGKTYSNTLLKSQAHGAKDSLVIEVDGRYLWPSENCMRLIMGLHEDFTLEATGQTVASEIIGQGIDVPLHTSVIRAVKRHIEAWTIGARNVGASAKNPPVTYSNPEKAVALV